MHSVPSCALAALLTGLAPVAHAQTTFGLGPLVGGNAASARYGESTYPVLGRAGVEAGLQGVVGFGHFALQPALLFSQKGFGATLEDEYELGDHKTTTATYRLNYLTLPLNVAYALQADGRGFQVFAGPYVGLLMGGHYTTTTTHDQAVNALPDTHGSGTVVARNAGPASGASNDPFYSRPVDAGLQFGVGYRLGHALLHAGYSRGLRNVAADRQETDSVTGQVVTHPLPPYYNRAFQVSLAYLVGSTR